MIDRVQGHGPPECTLTPDKVGAHDIIQVRNLWRLPARTKKREGAHASAGTVDAPGARCVRELKNDLMNSAKTIRLYTSVVCTARTTTPRGAWGQCLCVRCVCVPRAPLAL